MITLSNGHNFEYMVASGALAFDGKGWFWERPLVWLGLIKLKLFTIVIKTLTRHPRAGNLRWWKPWTCIRLIPGGSVNKVGLTNPGIEWWCKKIGPKINHNKLALIGSIYGTRQELVEMAEMLNDFDLVGLEVNTSCPNTGHPIADAQSVIDDVISVKKVSRHPVIVKLSVTQDYLKIAKELQNIVEAVALNSVPWERAFFMEKSPLSKLEKRVSGGGGGVSGKPAQKFNWRALGELSEQKFVPVIAPSVMCYKDVEKIRKLHPNAISFGAIHLRTPWKPTQIVKKEMLCGHKTV
jgi:dihydroorotate dehydrogenase